MKFGFSREAFGNLLVLSAFIVIIVMGVIFFVAHKRGLDVTTHRFALTIGMGCVIIFGVVPFWLTDLTVKQKLMGTTLALAVAIGNYFAIDRMQRVLRDKKKKDDQ